MASSVMVALSGGVDSSLAAALLVEQGHQVVGVTLKTFCYGDIPAGVKACCGLEGVAAARAVAGQLGIQHLVFDVEQEFHREVIADFVSEYAAGRTPNPCVRCNATVKIPWLLNKARAMGYPKISTGHYARIEELPTGEFGLFRGRDVDKDQSYFLWEIPRDILPDVSLPIGSMTKSQVRAEAQRRGLPTASRPESQEICFVPEGTYLSFLRKFLPAGHPGFQPGPIRDAEGISYGTHSGYLGFTVGQRKGLGGGHGRRLYVIGIRPETREVIIGTGPELEGCDFSMDRVNFLSLFPPSPDEEVLVQIRHRAPPVPGRIKPADTAGVRLVEAVKNELDRPVEAVKNELDRPVGAAKNELDRPVGAAKNELGRLVEAAKTEGSWLVDLVRGVRAITPGQSAVIYQGDRLIMGGRIR